MDGKNRPSARCRNCSKRVVRVRGKWIHVYNGAERWPHCELPLDTMAKPDEGVALITNEGSER